MRINPHCRGTSGSGTGNNGSDYEHDNSSNSSSSSGMKPGPGAANSRSAAHVGSCTVGYSATSRFAHPALKPLLGEASTRSGIASVGSGSTVGAGRGLGGGAGSAAAAAGVGMNGKAPRQPNVSVLAARAELAW